MERRRDSRDDDDVRIRDRGDGEARGGQRFRCPVCNQLRGVHVSDLTIQRERAFYGVAQRKQRRRPFISLARRRGTAGPT